MSKVLTDAQIDQFRAEGWAGPIKVYSEDEMAALRQRVEKFEAANPTEGGKLYQGPHLLFPWLYDVLHVPHLVAAWQDLFGPNLLSVTTGFRIKNPSTDSYVGWHQDAYYVRYQPFWSTCILAFTESTIENGCVQVVPGSHKLGLLPHEETDDENNILTRGQHITVPFDRSRAIHVKLRPGELIVMDHLLIHGSDQNHSKDRRINFLIDVLPTFARVDLAAAFRMAARLGYQESIGGHFSVEVPGATSCFILNPMGLFWSEITASKLIVVDHDGNKVSGDGQLEPTAFHIHAAIHRA